MYLTFANIDTMEEDFLEQTRGRDIDLVVCSDAEAILGIGDQGVGVTKYNTMYIRSMMHILISISLGNRRKLVINRVSSGVLTL